MQFLSILVIFGTIMAFQRRDTAKRMLLAIAVFLIGRYAPVGLDAKIIFASVSMSLWYWAVFGYGYLSARNMPIRKYL